MLPIVNTHVRTSFLAMALFFAVLARALGPVPPLTGSVIDQTGTISAAQQSDLEQKLLAFEDRKGSHIAVLIVASTAPETIESYALRVAEQWKLGRKRVDDGAILVIAKDDRALRIEAGYGLEGALNDATSRRIVGEVIAPRFRDGDFGGGIAAGVDQMLRVIEGEPLSVAGRSAGGIVDLVEEYLPFVVATALILAAMLRFALGGVLAAAATGGIVGIVMWVFVGLLSAFIAGAIAFIVALLGGVWRARHSPGSRGGGSAASDGFRSGGDGFGGGGTSGRW